MIDIWTLYSFFALMLLLKLFIQQNHNERATFKPFNKCAAKGCERVWNVERSVDYDCCGNSWKLVMEKQDFFRLEYWATNRFAYFSFCCIYSFMKKQREQEREKSVVRRE